MTMDPIRSGLRNPVRFTIRIGIRSASESDPTYGRTDGLTKKDSPTVEILQLGNRARKPNPNPTMTAPLTRQLQPTTLPGLPAVDLCPRFTCGQRRSAVTACSVVWDASLGASRMSDKQETRCPDCGSTKREQKFRCAVCADCRVVLDDQTPPTFAAVEQVDGSLRVEDRLARLAERVRTCTEADDDR